MAISTNYLQQLTQAVKSVTRSQLGNSRKTDYCYRIDITDLTARPFILTAER